jgi:hypothetical protein
MQRERISIAVFTAVLTWAAVGSAIETNRTERGTLTYEYGSLVFTTSSSTNRYPLADKKQKKPLPPPGLSFVSLDDTVLVSTDGDTSGFLTIHLRTSSGAEFALDEHKPLPVTVETQSHAEGGKTNVVWVWRLLPEDGSSNTAAHGTALPRRP